MNEIVIKKATRVGVRPLIGLYSESGCGKTYSALLLARGFVGPNGKVAIIDSESGRASLYADCIAGGFDTLELDEPFSPENYIKAMKCVENAGYSIGIIDSATHEWSAVLDLAAEMEERTKKAGLHCWRVPKLSHAKFMVALLRSPIPWVICVRSKCKSRQIKDAHGKTQIIRDDFTSPLQSEEFTFELTVHGEVMSDHSFRLTKSSHPELRKCFPEGKPITIETGESVARWCQTPDTRVNATTIPTESPTLPDKMELSGILRDCIEDHKHGPILYGFVFDTETIGTTDEALYQVAICLIEKSVTVKYKMDGKHKRATSISPNIEVK